MSGRFASPPSPRGALLLLYVICIEAVVVTPATVELAALGATVQLTAAVRDQNGQAIAGAAVAARVSGAADVAPVASDLMDLPLKVLRDLGGWKTAQTVLQCYQRPDEGWLRKALEKYRETGFRSN